MTSTVIWTFIFLQHALVVRAVYFSQESPLFCLPIPSHDGTAIGRVLAYPSSDDKCTSSVLNYTIPDSLPVSITSNGTIVTNVDASSIDADQSIQFQVTASCQSNDGHTRSAKTTVSLHPVNFVNTGRINTAMSEGAISHACFTGMSDVVRVEENVANVVLGRLHGCATFDGYTRKYRAKPKQFVSIDQSNSEINLLKPLDRDALGTISSKGSIIHVTGIKKVNVSCDLSRNGVRIGTSRRTFDIQVDNVNDSLPFFQSNKLQKLVTDVNVKDKEDVTVTETIEDNDSWNNGSYTVRVVTDNLRVCQATELLCYGQQQNKNICLLKIHIQGTNKITKSLYKCEIEVIDDTFLKNTDNKVTLTINIHKSQNGHQNRIVKHFFRNATRLARLLEMKQEYSSTYSKNGTYSLIHDIFKITNKTGIIYVDNTERLVTSSDLLSLEVMTPVGGVINITVAMIGSARQIRDEETCGEMCARHKTTDSCVGSCGLGLTHSGCVMRGSEHSSPLKMYGTCTYNIDFCPDRVCDELEQMYPLLCPQDCISMGSCGLGLTHGGCVMRGSEYSTSLKMYGTCTYNIDFCPDRVCDELEQMYPLLCPQDCITKRTGLGILNKKTGRGIEKAPGPCWCEQDWFRNDVEVSCHCYPASKQPKQTKVNEPKDPTGPAKPFTIIPSKVTTRKNPLNPPTLPQPRVYTVNNSVNNNSSLGEEHSTLVATEKSTVTCDNACGTAIGLGLGAFIAIAFSLFMLWFTKRRNDRRKSNMKHVGSVVSMSIVPSDYVDERERRSSYSSPQWSPKSPIYMTQSMVIENENQKWEFPRDNLTLDKTLGEGEFGVVVKGLAFGIDGENSVKEVAVKMLKHCSTQMEELDLLSEFNLLKDVSHPNVIRLLGACTQDGPFYVIVEFCQHGCLLKYLRRSRLEENGYVNTHRRFKSPNAKEQTDSSLEGDLLSIRDLLSFAWQIAKGMSYLSEIKLVHRDLAARNVLVARDRVLKISDFGLTRDVYEADTYMKKSKGRIPVKWLAPESLYAQIYTTRSDIWSYGIVLWEIVTLGAPPYPGIPPERLYNLLLGGYRMDKPENCPDEMYAVMQKCWKIDAADRPPFASLAEIFDRILQEKTGYLDLNGQDLYSKCFESTLQDLNHIGDSRRSRKIPENNNQTFNQDDTVDKIMNITTVCNDSYLTPLNLRRNDRDKLTPLLENHGNSDHENTNHENSSHGNSNHRNSNRDRFNSHLSDIRRSAKTRHFVNQNRKNHIDSSADKIVTKNMKNKHVIYPCENVSLLMDHNSAKFTNAFNRLEDSDDTQIEVVV